MSRIIYKPTCSNCGAVLDCDVSYTEERTLDGRIIMPTSEISPCACPNCGEFFEEIIIPNYRKTWNFSTDISVN